MARLSHPALDPVRLPPPPYRRPTRLAPSASRLGRILQVRLDAVQAQKLAAALDAGLATARNDPAALLQAAQRLARRLPSLAPQASRAFAALGGGALDAVYLTRLPRGEARARLISATIASAVAMPFAYDLEGGGAIPMSIAPKPGSPPNTNSSTAEFCDHTDDGFLVAAARPEFLILAGARSSARVPTFYSPVDEALRRVPPPIRPALFEPLYTIRTPISFELPNGAAWSAPRALLAREPGGRVELAFPSFGTRGLCAEAEAALDALAGALRAVRRPFHVEPGTALAFDNRRGTHARGPIDGADRLLFRTYARRSLAAMRAATGCEGPVFPLADLIEMKD